MNDLHAPSPKATPTVLKDFHTVLVLGGDVVATRLVERLGEEGFKVVCLGEGPEAADHGIVSGTTRFIPGGKLKYVHGVVGSFTAGMDTPQGFVKHQVGFVVAAQPPVMIPRYDEYGLQPASRIIPLSIFAERLQFANINVSRKSDWLHVAFFAGLKESADTTTFSRIFDSIERLGSQQNVQCYVFTRHLKVAEDGLEGRYRKSRESGTLFFAFDDNSPVVEQKSHDDLKIIFSDPQLSLEFELAPDILVIDEKLLPPDSLEPLWAMIPSSPRAKPFLTPESPRYPYVETAKAGVFAVGPARGEFYPDKIQRDIESVIASLKKLVRLQADRSFRFAATVEETKCTLCLTCVRICPHGAIQFAVSAFVDKDSCVGCGICVSECPMRALSMAEKDSANNDSLLSTLQLAGKIVAFLCEHSGANAFEEIPQSLKAMVKPIVVSCAGSVGEIDIMQAFIHGARGVLVAGCFQGNCASIYGTNLASYRVASLKRIMEQTAFGPERVIFVPSASNAPDGLVSVIQSLQKLPGNPVQGS